MILRDPFPPTLPEALQADFTTRLVRDEDVESVVALMTEERSENWQEGAQGSKHVC